MAPTKQEGSTRSWKSPMRGMRSAWWSSSPGRRFPWPRWNHWSRPPCLMNGLILSRSRKWKCIYQGESVLPCHCMGDLHPNPWRSRVGRTGTHPAQAWGSATPTIGGWLCQQCRVMVISALHLHPFQRRALQTGKFLIYPERCSELIMDKFHLDRSHRNIGSLNYQMFHLGAN